MSTNINIKLLCRNDNNTYNANIFEVASEISQIKKYYCPVEELQNKIKKKNDDEFLFDGDEIFEKQIIDNVGEFFSFKNKAIRIKFFDRTILQINSQHEKIFIIDNQGNNQLFNLNRLNKDNFANNI